MPVFGSEVTSAETRLTTPSISGVRRWLKAGKRRTAGWSMRTLSMSCGWIFTSTASWSESGTMSIAGSEGVTSPPIVCTVI